MQIAGLQEFTTVDYPGQLAATIFTLGCNFRCPFCHNPDIVNASRYHLDQLMPEENFWQFLRERKGKLDGICITGGEPTLQPDLLDFMGKIKDMGFLVKLDSNGTNPSVLKRACQRKLVDYLAMDIKNAPQHYAETVGLPQINLSNIQQSVRLIMESGVDYEFRTTVVPGFHDGGKMEGLGKFIEGAKKFFVQGFRPDVTLDQKLRGEARFSGQQLQEFKKILDKYIEKVEIRP